RDVAGSEAVGCKAAHEIGTGLEIVENAQLLSAPGLDVAGLRAGQADDVRQHFVVVTAVDGVLDEVHIATDAGEILLEIDRPAGGGALVVVQRIPRNRVADERDDLWARV